MILPWSLAWTILFGAIALAETDKPAKPIPPPPIIEQPDEVVVSQHTLQLGKDSLAYTASTGYLTVWKDPDASPREPKCKIFYVAYTRANQIKETRPLAFCFNGGPGSASIWLHLGLGPRTVVLPVEGGEIPPPYHLIDNSETWLDQCDLVFVDPVPTGYSRAATGVNPSEFEGYENDLGVCAEFIRSYINLNKRWLSPKVLVGESYGTVRVAGLASLLPEKYHVGINGLVLISQALNYESERSYLMALPTYAAAAWYHGKIAPRYQSQTLEQVCTAAETYIHEVYAPAMFEGDALPKEKQKQIAHELGEFTGINEESILENSLQIPHFQAKVLHSASRSTGTYDTRYVNLDAQGHALEELPSNSYPGAFSSYLSEELNFHPPSLYHVFSGPWKIAQKLVDFDLLHSAFGNNPNLKVWIAGGRYDLVTPYYSAKFGLSQLYLDPVLHENVQISIYPAGHMIYTDKAARLELKSDFITWMQNLLMEKSPATLVK